MTESEQAINSALNAAGVKSVNVVAKDTDLAARFQAGVKAGLWTDDARLILKLPPRFQVYPAEWRSVFRGGKE